jgi:hypothetical protein
MTAHTPWRYTAKDEILKLVDVKQDQAYESYQYTKQ